MCDNNIYTNFWLTTLPSLGLRTSGNAPPILQQKLHYSYNNLKVALTLCTQSAGLHAYVINLAYAKCR